MDNIKLLIDKNDEFIFTLNNGNIDLTSENVDVKLDINPIIDYEKGIYTNRSTFNLKMHFYSSILKNRDSNNIVGNGLGDFHREKWVYTDKMTNQFGTSLSRLGYNFPTDISRKNFNKSNIVIEFYSDKEGLSKWLGSEIYYFNEINEYKNDRRVIKNGENYNGKMIDIIINEVTDPFIDIKIGEKFLNEFFGYRDFKQYTTSDSIVLYYKVLIQNAKNGVRYYMINGKDGVINNRDYNEELLYNEVTLYKDRTFEFNNITNGELNFKELIII